jgi:hypothetical protein
LKKLAEQAVHFHRRGMYEYRFLGRKIGRRLVVSNLASEA